MTTSNVDTQRAREFANECYHAEATETEEEIPLSDCARSIETLAAEVDRLRAERALLVRVAVKAVTFASVANREVPSVRRSAAFGNMLEYLREALDALDDYREAHRE